jgi:hypothetical protein
VIVAGRVRASLPIVQTGGAAAAASWTVVVHLALSVKPYLTVDVKHT